MRSARSILAAGVSGFFLTACGGGTEPSAEPCDEASTQTLPVGEHVILTPSTDRACLRLPSAGGDGAEHLYVALATSTQEADGGISAPYTITGSSPAAASPNTVASPLLSAFRPPTTATAFHNLLRARERALSASPSAVHFNKARLTPTVVVPPVPGEQRTFNVCTSRQCNSFVGATATARVVGQRVAIFVDNDAPAGGYTDADIAHVGTLFDDFLYPIDTTAFGRESDIDANGVVIVLLTQRVNALSPDCSSTGSVVLGYFFGADLLPLSSDNPGSNEAEIFYGLVPDPANLDCDVPREYAQRHLPATFIHELQHMISFNQHVLVRRGRGEVTWLNEGLSHFAEELGGRLIPDTECPVTGSCSNEFLHGDLQNAFDYLASPEDYFLIEPGASSGELAERGANWLFVRWLVDHFASDSVLGSDLTRRLVGTELVGAANLAAQTGADPSVLITEWQMTNYLDDLPGFNRPSARLRYKTWNFRTAADSTGRVFPLAPAVTEGGDYTQTGVLRAGSGPHVLVTQAAGAAPVDLLLTNASGREAVSRRVAPRVGLVRIR